MKIKATVATVHGETTRPAPDETRPEPRADATFIVTADGLRMEVQCTNWDTMPSWQVGDSVTVAVS
jgi:hypothetical protein